MQQDVAPRLARVEEAGGFQDGQRVLLAERMHRLERQLQLATETTTALGGGGGGLPRPSSRGSVGASGSGAAVAAAGQQQHRGAVPPPLSTVARGGGAGGAMGAGAGVAVAEEPKTPDPTRRDHTLRAYNNHHAPFPAPLPPAVGPPPALAHSQLHPPPLPQHPPGASVRFGGPSTATVHRTAAAAGTGGIGGLEAIPAPMMHAGTAAAATTAGAGPPVDDSSTLRGASSPAVVAAAVAAPGAFFFHQPEPPASARSEAGGEGLGMAPGADSSLRSFASVGGGGMPTIWRGTASVALGDEATMGATGASVGGQQQQQQQLESLRREKQLLRTRIQQGLLTLSQSSPGLGRPPTPQQQQPLQAQQQQPQYHMSRSAGAASVGGGRSVGGLEGAHGSVSSMV